MFDDLTEIELAKLKSVLEKSYDIQSDFLSKNFEESRLHALAKLNHLDYHQDTREIHEKFGEQTPRKQFRLHDNFIRGSKR